MPATLCSKLMLYRVHEISMWGGLLPAAAPWPALHRKDTMCPQQLLRAAPAGRLPGSYACCMVVA